MNVVMQYLTANRNSSCMYFHHFPPCTSLFTFLPTVTKRGCEVEQLAATVASQQEGHKFSSQFGAFCAVEVSAMGDMAHCPGQNLVLKKKNLICHWAFLFIYLFSIFVCLLLRRCHRCERRGRGETWDRFTSGPLGSPVESMRDRELSSVKNPNAFSSQVSHLLISSKLSNLYSECCESVSVVLHSPIFHTVRKMPRVYWVKLRQQITSSIIYQISQ